jgi:hypothetical protein
MRSLAIALALTLMACVAHASHNNEPKVPGEGGALHIRDDDAGVLVRVNWSDVDPEHEIDFELDQVITDTGPRPDLLAIGNRFAGQTEECLPPSVLNPCVFCGGSGEPSSNGKLIDAPFWPIELAPSALTWRERSGRLNAASITQSYFSQTLGRRANFTRNGCAQWGDSGWTLVMEESYNAMCIDVLTRGAVGRIDGSGLGSRVHFQLSADERSDADPSRAKQIAHQDLIDADPSDYTRICWGDETGEARIKALALWPQNTELVWIGGLAFGKLKFVSEPDPEPEPPSIEVCDDLALMLEEIDACGLGE